MYRLFHWVFLVFFLLFFSSCEKEEVKQVKKKESIPGDVQVLNSCGIKGAASSMRDYLRSNGFYVVSISNDRLHNYEETVLVIHTPGWEGEKALAQTLKTKNVLHVKNKRAYVDASVYIGKDLDQIIQQDEL